ncbi:hypothetical protein [Streptomyces phaeofaciens]|uniref:hypothetical protein n=1 Tax=Streptomyces phaeofaciens TaxID=68254 RepID=UPI003686FE5F
MSGAGRSHGNAVYDYVAAVGGCSEEWGDRPVRDVRCRGNFWDDALPGRLERREFPGAWPPADEQHPEEGCGDPHDLEFTGNTLLPAHEPGARLGRAGRSHAARYHHAHAGGRRDTPHPARTPSSRPTIEEPRNHP